MGMGVWYGCGALKEIDDLIEMKGEMVENNYNSDKVKRCWV